MGTIASQITSLTMVYSTVYSDADQRKHQNSASLAFVRGIHRRPVNSTQKWPVTRKMFSFDDVIMDMHHYVLPVIVHTRHIKTQLVDRLGAFFFVCHVKTNQLTWWLKILTFVTHRWQLIKICSDVNSWYKMKSLKRSVATLLYFMLLIDQSQRSAVVNSKFLWEWKWNDDWIYIYIMSGSPFANIWINVNPSLDM